MPIVIDNFKSKKGASISEEFALFNCMKSIHDKKYSKSCVKQPLPKIPQIGFQDQISLNAGQKYCVLQYFRPFIKLPFVIKIFVLSIFERPFYTGFTVLFQSLDSYQVVINFSSKAAGYINNKDICQKIYRGIGLFQ